MTGGPFQASADLLSVSGPRASVRCLCGKVIFDGLVVKGRVVRIPPRGKAEALCRCKRWVMVPLAYQG